MKILHIISSVNPTGGGPIEGVKQLGRLNEDRGNHVELASLDAPGAPFLNDCPFPVHPLGPGTLAYGYSPRLVPWLKENLCNYDIVIVNGIWQYNSFGAWRVLHLSSTPYVVFIHGMLDPWFKRTYPLKHLKKSFYWPWAEYRVLRDAVAVLFTSEEERILARQSFWPYNANEKVVNYGIRTPSGNKEIQRREFHERFPHLRNKRLLLFMGRIHPKKGCDLALRSFAAALPSDPNLHLVMAGPDQIGWQASMQSLAEDLQIANRITWTGMISGDLKMGALYSAEAFFLPSHQENFGIVVAEALSCGLPVLISDKVNIWREVQADGAGLVAPDNLAGASSLLESWMRLADSQRIYMRECATQSFRNRFAIDQSTSSLPDLLQQLVTAAAPKSCVSIKETRGMDVG